MRRLFVLLLGVTLPALAQTAVKPVTSPPLRLLQPATDTPDLPHLVPNYRVPAHAAATSTPVDTVVQNGPVNLAHSPDVVGLNFDGVGVSNSAPPDTNGRVGKNHYVQWVNTKLAVYDKSGNLLYGPVKGNTLFQSLGGTCASHNDGDPIAQYDILADRWVLTQFAVNATDGSFSHQCVAVSMTGDPLGQYYLYDFRTSSQADPKLFVDYPHVGVWPDGYYVTAHLFGSDGSFFQGLYVLDRNSMLAGLPATFQFHNFGFSLSPEFTYGGALAADLDSLTPPPAGSPEYVLQHGSPDVDGSAGFVVHIFKIKTTWGSSPSLTVTGPTDVTIAPFNGELCTPFIGVEIELGERPCVPTPAPSSATNAAGTPYTPADYWLDGIGDRLMYRVAYRNYGDHEAIVLNHTVNASAQQAGVRWYELKNPGTAPALVQQGTYTGPTPDLSSRWMGSIAQDNSGDIVVGYTKASPALLAEIDVAGRQPGDLAGFLGSEILMKASGGVQIDTGNRWGDYSSMTVDPLDGCTFWYAAEYIPSDGSFNWKTRIGTFRYSTCTAPPQGTISGTVTDCVSGAPLSHAMVQVSNGFSGTTDGNGHYSITLPPGSYTLSASAPGRLCAPSSSSSVSVANGGTATKNFCLTGSPKLDFASYAINDGANNTVNKDECIKMPVTLSNDGCGAATNVTATLSTTTAGVTVNTPQASLGTIPLNGSSTTSTPFAFSTSSANGFQCGAPINFTLAVASDQGSNTQSFSVPTCQATPTTVTGSITLDDPQQNARLGRNSVASSCASAKACPAPLGSGTRSFDQYTFVNSGTVDACVTVNLTADTSCSGNNEIFSAVYLDSYDPQNLCTNYLGDEGQSPDLGFNSYSVDIPAGRTFIVVVNAVQAGGVCPSYTLNVSGLIDNATTGSGACPAPPVVTCIDDNDASITYASGWHLIDDASASGGHFRMNAGTNAGTAASLTVSVPTGSTGALTYNYATSPKGGSADVYIDGTFRGTVSYLGTSGSTRAPQFGSNSNYSGLAAGQHTFELRNMKGVAYVDGFCLSSAASTGTPSSGPGATTTSSGSAAAGQPIASTVAVPPGAQSLAVVAEASAAIPMQLVAIDPNGVATVATGTGIVTLNVPVSSSGMYTIQAVNLSLGPVSLWTAATPQVSR